MQAACPSELVIQTGGGNPDQILAIAYKWHGAEHLGRWRDARPIGFFDGRGLKLFFSSFIKVRPWKLSWWQCNVIKQSEKRKVNKVNHNKINCDCNESTRADENDNTIILRCWSIEIVQEGIVVIKLHIFCKTVQNLSQSTTASDIKCKCV